MKPRRSVFSQRDSYCIFLQVKNCTVGIVDDNIYEDDEMFMLKIARPLGTDQCEARIGTLNSTNITITNSEDGQYWLFSCIHVIPVLENELYRTCQFTRHCVYSVKINSELLLGLYENICLEIFF